MGLFEGQDALLSLRNAFYTGAHAQVIGLASQTLHQPTDPRVALEARVLLHRAQIALGQGEEVIRVLPAGSTGSVELEAVRIWAQYQLAPGLQDQCVAEMTELLGAGMPSSTTAVIAGTLFLTAKRLEDVQSVVLRHLHQDIECVGLAVSVYLSLNRQDLAAKCVQEMRGWADDATLAQLIEALTLLAEGGEKNVQTALLIFQENAQSKAPTSKLLTEQAVCYMSTGAFVRALSLLEEAIRLNPRDTTALVNAIVCQCACGIVSPSPLTDRLRVLDPNHIYLQELDEKRAGLEKAIASFAG